MNPHPLAARHHLFHLRRKNAKPVWLSSVTLKFITICHQGFCRYVRRNPSLNCLNNTIQYNTIQYNTIQYNTIQYNTIQYNTIQYNAMQCSAVQCGAVRCGAEQSRALLCIAVQCSAVQCSAVQCSAVQCSAVQCSAVQCSAVQCSAVQCSAVQCSAVQGSAVQYNTIQYNKFYFTLDKDNIVNISSFELYTDRHWYMASLGHAGPSWQVRLSLNLVLPPCPSRWCPRGHYYVPSALVTQYNVSRSCTVC